MSYRAALIGCGKIGSEFADDPLSKDIYSHAGAYAACPDTTLVAVCDRDEGKAIRCAERWNVAVSYTDAGRMLAEQQPDIVSVCTPDVTHAALIRVALNTPGVRAVVAEKPLALELEAARELVALADEEGVLLAVNYSRRYSQMHNDLTRLIAAGEIGAVQSVAGFYTKGTLHNGTHWFDLARLLVGEITTVRGFDLLHEGGADPTLSAFLEFANGAGGCLQACHAGAFSLLEMDVVGTQGRVRIANSGRTAEVYQVVDDPDYSGYRALEVRRRLDGGMHNLLLHAVEDVVRCLNDGTPPLCSGNDGLQALRVGLAIIESARSGCAVRLGQA